VLVLGMDAEALLCLLRLPRHCCSVQVDLLPSIAFRQN
jgi:hypothetical protein